MPLDRAGVINKIDTLKKAWETRNKRFETYYELREMHDPRKRAKELSIALNDARVFLDLAIHMLSFRPPTIRVPVIGQPETQQEAAGGAEVFLHGIQRQIDADRFDMGLAPWMRDMADYITTTGWWSDNNFVERNEDGTPLFVSEVLDPAQVFPEFGFRQTTAIAHMYPTNLSEVQTKQELFGWDGDFAGDGSLGVEIQDLYWIEDEMVWNAVLVRHQDRRGRDEQREFAVQPMAREGLDAIPMRTGPTGGWAVRSSRPISKKQQEHYGESILAAGEPIFDAKNAWATIALRKAEESISPITGLRSNSGRWTVSEKDLRSGVAIPMARDQDVEFKERPGLTTDVANVVMPMLESAIRRAGPNDLLLGNVNPNDMAGAGFALSLLEPRLLSQLMPYAQTLERIGASRDSMFLAKFRTGDFAPIRLASRNDEARDVRKVYYQEWSAGDLPDTDLVMWEISLSMPDQLQQQISIMRQAIPEGDLLDLDTGLERLIKVDDIARVKKGIENQRIRRDPAIAAIDAIEKAEQYADFLRDEAEAARADGDRRLAARLERSIRLIDAVVESRVQEMGRVTGQQPQQQALPGRDPQTFGTQETRRQNGTLEPAQGAPGQRRNGNG